MTKTQAKLVAAMKAAIADGSWAAVSGDTIRYTETKETPKLFKGNGHSRWPGDTYSRHIFLTFTARGPILGVARAPWVGRDDLNVTYRRAFEVLANPAYQFGGGSQ